MSVKIRAQFLIASISIVSVLSGCNSTAKSNKYTSANSYLIENQQKTTIENAEVVKSVQTLNTEAEQLRFIPPYKIGAVEVTTAQDTLKRFSIDETLTIAADELALKDYLHQVFGEQLKLNYVLSDDIKNDTNLVTLNLQDKISERKLFTLTEKLLTERNYVIRLNDNIFYLHKKEDASKGEVVYGYGKKISDIPQTSLDIIQIVPFDYGLQASLPNTMRVLLGINAQADIQRGVITIQGRRNDIVRALELVNLLDRPSLYERHIGAFKSNYISTRDLVVKIEQLLNEEGIDLTKNGGGKGKAPLSVVELETQSSLIFFSTSESLIERAVFWAQQIDKPIKTTEIQYFLYQPQYSRAADLGVSLEALIGGAGHSNSTSVTSENKKNQGGGFNFTARSASSDGLKMVVDERANTLIFYTSGERYQQLVPLIKQLDILPKQVMLEVVIAEVTLSDEFKQGVEFAFNNANYGIATQGAFMGGGFGGLSYLLKGANGSVALNMLQTNSLVNILSRPTLVVRDGVAATINVGTDIPIVGETTSDPISGDKQTTKIEYRKTGVELAVTPTVNAQGIVLMEIKQKISNQVEAGSTSSVNPSVFERSINTEVVAESGQTIILGGLISDNRTQKASKVPFFGDIPIIGALFRADTQGGDKTELVILVTPKVIHSGAEWAAIKDKFSQSLQNLTF